MPVKDYHERVADQIAQYATAKIHDVPPIFDYWSNTYIRPRLNSVCDADTVTGFYAEHIRQRARLSTYGTARVLSLGAGDAELEVRIAEQLLSGGIDEFRFTCLELSPILIDKANRRIGAAGLAEHVVMEQADLNSWSYSASQAGPQTAVIANHILHHVVELESLFDNIAAAIGASGVLLTADMIGRNGHMRWPEALDLVNALWDTLPESLKYNHISHKTDTTFQNWDCCAEGGFEGIRAQDILPLLVEHFQFENFLAFGGLPDVFCDRVYGPNFDPAAPAHTRFLDSVEQLNSGLLELGVLKPTMMYAAISNCGAPAARIWSNLSPRFCVRCPDNVELGTNRQPSEVLVRNETQQFCSIDLSENVLRAGWSFPEDWGTWMVGPEAVLELPAPPCAKNAGQWVMKMRAVAFIPRRLYSRSFTFKAGDQVIGGVTFVREDKGAKSFSLELDAHGRSPILLHIIAHEEASPAEDGSADKRKLGLGLVDVAVG